jgi:hypothetical protein
LILPDFVWVDKVLAEKLRLHLQRGGTIISSGYSGMRPDKSGFALDEYGLQYAGENPYHPIYIKVNGALMKGVPDMPLTIYPTERQGRQIVHGPMFINRSGAEVLATFWKPYFNSGDFDGTFLKHYSYCEKSIDRPAIVKAGNNIIHFSFPLFSGYAQHAVPVYRALFGNCLKMLHPDPLLVVAGLPVFAQINITAKNTERILHVISFLPEYKGQGNALGVESICLKDIRVSLKKRSKRACGAVYLAPSRQAIPFTQDQANIFFTIPKVEGYQMVVCD